MERIADVDLTDRARAGGWILPDGWSVKADLTYDDRLHPAHDGDWATPDQVRAWSQGTWEYTTVSVWVQDRRGREWGSAALSGLVYGGLPRAGFCDPLTDDTIAEHDMIREALEDAVSNLEDFGTPAISQAPSDITVTGL